MPDVVPNELNFEALHTFTSADDETQRSRVKLDFPLLVQPSGDKRVVNIITDVEYCYPPMPSEQSDMAVMLSGAVAEDIQRDWVMGLYHSEPTAAQTSPVTPGTTLTIGDPSVIDQNVFSEHSQTTTANVNGSTVAGTGNVRKNLQYMGIGTVVPQSYVWLNMEHTRTKLATAKDWTAATVKIGCRIKYVQTTLPLSEWVGLYFSSQQLGTS